ncbi:ribokinase [soil metagenome]
MTIAVLGSVNVDIVAYLERLPKAGETLAGHAYQIGLGGKGANQAVAVHKLSGDVRFIARIGADLFGGMASTALAAAGLDLTHVRRDEASSTGIALINVASNGENNISLISGANFAVDHTDIAAAGAVLGSAKILLLQLEVPLKASLGAARIVRAAGGMVILDPAPAPTGPFDREVAELANIITPNETETESLLGWRPETPEEGARAATVLRGRGFAITLVKLGSRGVAYSSPAGEGFVPPFKVEAIDTVAAGDCFNAGLASALAEGQNLAGAVRFAAACGALSTTKKGASAAAPTRAEVDAFLARA